jgi:hypothetical protein
MQIMGGRSLTAGACRQVNAGAFTATQAMTSETIADACFFRQGGQTKESV